MPTPEGIDAATAETVLLILGAVLKWIPVTPGVKPPEGFVYEMARVFEGDTHANYGVLVDRECQEGQVVANVTYWRENRLDKTRNQKAELHHYASLADAKAACERHLVSGNWSGMVKPNWKAIEAE